VIQGKFACGAGTLVNVPFAGRERPEQHSGGFFDALFSKIKKIIFYGRLKKLKFVGDLSFVLN
jgi:hypothetical protein